MSIIFDQADADAVKRHNSMWSKIQGQTVRELKRSAKSHGIDKSGELISSIKGKSKKNRGVTEKSIFGFAKQGLFQQLGVTGAFGNLSRGRGGILPKRDWISKPLTSAEEKLTEASDELYGDLVVNKVQFKDHRK